MMFKRARLTRTSEARFKD